MWCASIASAARQADRQAATKRTVNGRPKPPIGRFTAAYLSCWPTVHRVATVGVAYLSTASAHRSAKRRFMRFDAALHAAGPWCVAAGASHVDDTQSIDRTDSRNGTFVVKAFLLDAIDAMASERAPA